MVEIFRESGKTVFVELFGQVSFCGYYHGIVPVQRFESVLNTFYNAEFMKCQVGDYFLDSVVYLFRECAAAKLQCELLPLINCLFSEVNPIPAKAAVSAMGFGEENLRLPLTKMEPATRAKLYEEMRKLGIEV